MKITKLTEKAFEFEQVCAKFLIVKEEGELYPESEIEYAAETKQFTESVVYTHSGVFHADDVFASAFLKILKPDVEIRSVPRVPDENVFAFDIGNGRYDHHQSDGCFGFADLDDDEFLWTWSRGCAFTLILWDYAESLEPGLFEHLYSIYGKGIQEHDNGCCRDSLAACIGSMNPNWDSEENTDTCFEKAVDMAENLLRIAIESFRSKKRAEEIYNSFPRSFDNRAVVMDKYVPWQSYTTDELYVAFPSNREEGCYMIQAVPVYPGSMESKAPLPEEWRGKPAEDLPEGVTFCHATGFICQVRKDKVNEVLEYLISRIDNPEEKAIDETKE